MIYGNYLQSDFNIVEYCINNDIELSKILESEILAESAISTIINKIKKFFTEVIPRFFKMIKEKISKFKKSKNIKIDTNKDGTIIIKHFDFSKIENAISKIRSEFEYLSDFITSELEKTDGNEEDYYIDKMNSYSKCDIDYTSKEKSKESIKEFILRNIPYSKDEVSVKEAVKYTDDIFSFINKIEDEYEDSINNIKNKVYKITQDKENYSKYNHASLIATMNLCYAILNYLEIYSKYIFNVLFNEHDKIVDRIKIINGEEIEEED